MFHSKYDDQQSTGQQFNEFECDLMWSSQPSHPHSHPSQRYSLYQTSTWSTGEPQQQQQQQYNQFNGFNALFNEPFCWQRNSKSFFPQQNFSLEHLKQNYKETNSKSNEMKSKPTTTWASIASQPAKQQVKSLKSKMNLLTIKSSHSKWNSHNNVSESTQQQTHQQQSSHPTPSQPPPSHSHSHQHQHQHQHQNQHQHQHQHQHQNQHQHQQSHSSSQASECELYNPKEFDLNPRNARFFIIKSYSEDDVHRSIKYSIWCSTEHGNKRLDHAFRHAKGPIYLLFSVNGSGQLIIQFVYIFN